MGIRKELNIDDNTIKFCLRKSIMTEDGSEVSEDNREEAIIKFDNRILKE